MSDGALSQAEIDALLSGGGASGGGGGVSPGVSDPSVIENFLAGTVDSLSSNLSMMTGGTVNFAAPQVKNSARDDFLGELPDTVTAVKVDFTAGFPGEHTFLMSEELAKSIASLMNKEENITLDEMAMSVIGEVVSQMSGTEITALTNKTGNKAIAGAPPEAANLPKAAAALPPHFSVASYTVSINGADHTIWEVFGDSVAHGIVQALSAPPPGQSPQGGAPPLSAASGTAGGVLSGGGYGVPPNMQSVQFPNLNNAISPREQGNIGLLMDVFMEMTVELGRTRKLIKEILLMGEGTIIELDKLAGEPVDILVNHKLIAKGEVVVIDENFGVRVTEIVSPAERMPDMG